MKDIFFSVITLVYNTKEEYLRTCLDSLRSINYDNKEFIIINDGSNEETSKILEEYKPLLNATLINQENKGISASRMIALSIAKGDYILFVDSDDIADSNGLLDLNNIIKDFNPDLIHFDDFKFKKTLDNIVSNHNYVPEGIIDKDLAIEEVCKLHINGVSNKVAKKELFAGIENYINTSYINGEDFQQTTFLVLNSNNVYFTRKPINYYRITEEPKTYYVDNIIRDTNYLVPGYKMLFELSKTNDKHLATFKEYAQKSIVYYGFKLCNMCDSFVKTKETLDELNKQEIVNILKKIECRTSFVSNLLFTLLTKKKYLTFLVLAKLYKLVFGFDEL